MVPKWSVMALAFCSVSTSVALHAQKCIGQIALDPVPINMSVNMRMVSQGRGFEGRFAGGGKHVFGSVSGGSVEYDKGNKSRSYIMGADAGYSIKLGAGGPNICPLVSLNYENGPDNIVVARTDLRAFAGVSMGGAARLSQTLSLVSFIGGGYHRLRMGSKLYNQPVSQRFTSNTGMLMGGVGLQSRERYLLRASLQLPYLLGDTNGEHPAYFVVGFTFSPSGLRASR